ncbi:hypothetical protein GDO86_004857 [Hymenochirus boettgeri]|uniref:Olfactory receptor n=1 Tax=Hymenochirus boettgeri TaxID=247094 RepID=A0A8T2K6Q3_9PIPI|nr:hypothetical protein GDO86_004857 [Hymenochirus boettgeri]
MVTTNQSILFPHTEFVLYGFPGVSQTRFLLGITFLFLYVVILTANGLILYLICIEKTLRSPMYLLISLLLSINVTCTTSIMPRAILDFFLLIRISLSSCLVQMFFIYFMTTCESNVLLLMSLDRYVAICRPLRYHTIMNKNLMAWLTLTVFIRSGVLVCPLVVFTSMVPFCRSNIILNFVCENMALLGLACGDISKPQIAGLIARILVTVFDVTLLLMFYSNILYSAMKTTSGKSRHKALNTCGTHLMVAMLAYLSTVASSIAYRMESSISVDTKNVFSALYLIIPAKFNPFIYGLRLTEIRRNLGKYRKRSITLDIP